MKKIIHKYCTEEHTIDGVKTYIIPKECYDELYHDIEISELCDIMKKHSLYSVKYLKETDISEIFLSIVFAYREIMYDFIPCYKYNEKLYHVAFKTGWFCLECRQPNTFNGIYVIPMSEDDPLFLPLDVTPEIPPVFKKMPCRKCGKPLSRRFMKIS